MEILHAIVDLGPSVMLPLIILVIGLLLRQGIGKSLAAGLTIGAGFVGIGLVISLLTDNLGPAASAMASRFGIGLSVIDVGWPGSAPMAWASSIGLLAIPIAIGVNMLMLVTKLTRVVSVDIWNIWHVAFTGVIVQIATGNLWIGLAAMAVQAAIAYKLGDMFSPLTEGYFGLTGVAIPHGSPAAMGIIAVPIDDLIERMPGIRRITLTTEHLEKRLGAFGQPLVVGTVFGFAIGLLASYNLGASLQLGVQMGAVMLLMPLMVKLIVQGLMPIAAAAQEMLRKRFTGSSFTIGLDPALLLGDSQVVAAGLLFVPITVALAVIVPGNRVLPFGDLATVGFFVAMAVGVHRGNLFRTLISGSVIMAITLWIATRMISLQTELATRTDLLGGVSEVGALDQGGNPVTYLLAKGLAPDITVGFIVILVVYLGSFLYTYVKYRRGTLFRAPLPVDSTASSGVGQIP